MVTTHFIYDGDQLLAEADDSNVITKRYTNEPNQYTHPIAQYDVAAEEARYFHYDAIGSTHDVTDETGTVTDTIDYDSWGNVLARLGLTNVPFQFCGEHGYYRDEETEQYYVMARIYDPRITRWLSEDPFPQADRDSLYVYSKNNPCSIIDPSGLAPFNLLEWWKKQLEKIRNKIKGWNQQRLRKECQDWMNRNDHLGYDWLKRIPDCPCKQADLDPKTFSKDLSPLNLHPGSDVCYRSPKLHIPFTFDPDKLTPPGQQCCFKDGKLVTNGPGAGTPDRYSPSTPLGGLDHVEEDVEPAIVCKKAGMTDEYLKRRPPNKGKDRNGNPCPELRTTTGRRLLSLGCLHNERRIDMLRRNGMRVGAFLSLVFLSAWKNLDANEPSASNDLLTFVRDGMLAEIQNIAKASHVDKAESVEAAISIALDKTNNIEARADALLSLAISELRPTVPAEKIIGLLTDRNEDISVRNAALYLCTALLHQQQSVEAVEAALFKILKSTAYEDGARLSTANVLLHFGSSTHALARCVLQVINDPKLSDASIESFGTILYALSAAYNRISTDEAVNWMISRHPPSEMNTEQKLKYLSVIWRLEHHAELTDDDLLEHQTIVDMQLYFEQEFSNSKNHERVRGFAVTYIDNPAVLQPQTLQAAREILADDTSPDYLRKGARAVLKLSE